MMAPSLPAPAHAFTFTFRGNIRLNYDDNCFWTASMHVQCLVLLNPSEEIIFLVVLHSW